MPVRQWVISVPKRLRWFLAERAEAVAALTRIFVSEVERLVRDVAGMAASPNTADNTLPRVGAISFLHRFGSALNRHVHLHVCVTDGVFQGDTAAIAEPAVTFHAARPITPGDLDTLTERVRR
ncbi:MAG: transposase, partial [Pirellulales bacterium]